jgi:NitT/TauT family transport system substrate-binding protein
VRKFVEASILGWYNYLYGDRKAADAMIKKANPEARTTSIRARSTKLMKKLGIVDSGDAPDPGIGAMTEARIKDFHDKMVKAGPVQAGRGRSVQGGDHPVCEQGHWPGRAQEAHRQVI